MGDAERAQDDFEQVGLPRVESGHLGAQRGDETAVDGAALLDAEDVDAEGVGAELRVLGDDVVVAAEVGRAVLADGNR
jgi:hypothetical protein